ncbi:DUF1272 domain-containing protein [Caulobacter segnis]
MAPSQLPSAGDVRGPAALASALARICTFEHTFCARCADLRFGRDLPRTARRPAWLGPIRPENQLHRYPASLRRAIRGAPPPSSAEREAEPDRPAGWA